MFSAPSGNSYGAKFYGTAAISKELGGGNWMAEGCGKCWKVQGWSNVPGKDSYQTTIVLKGTNYCPPENPACAEGKAHFDIAAPGFDVTEFSFANTCAERESGEIEGFESCGRWMIDDSNPDVGCDCAKFIDPVLRAGCQNFYSLQWDNSDVMYEEVDCPTELSRLNCWEENGGRYPDDIPQFCASNIDLTFPPSPVITNSPSLRGTSSPTKNPVVDLTSSPTVSPSKAPSASGGCCSWDVPNCGTDPWCNENKDHCENYCNGTYLDPNGTSEPTMSPNASPTGEGDYCCTTDLMNCKSDGDWCGFSEANCNTCGAKWIQLDTDCSIPWWGNCKGNPDSCCLPSTCHDFGGWAQCRI